MIFDVKVPRADRRAVTVQMETPVIPLILKLFTFRERLMAGRTPTDEAPLNMTVLAAALGLCWRSLDCPSIRKFDPAATSVEAWCEYSDAALDAALRWGMAIDQMHEPMAEVFGHLTNALPTPEEVDEARRPFVSPEDNSTASMSDSGSNTGEIPWASIADQPATSA